jgi:hypothetical protein
MPLQEVEEWRDVPGWEGEYQASSFGRVRSVARLVNYSDGRRRRYPDRLLTPQQLADGRWKVSFWRNNQMENCLVSKAVALAFHGDRPTGCECRHLDGDHGNNRPSNLAWGTHVENEADKLGHGTRLLGERHFNAKLTEEDVRRIRASRDTAASEATRYGIHEMHVYRIRRGERWGHVA